MSGISYGLLLSAFLMALIGAEIAKLKNRNPILWVLLCFFFGLIPLTILALLSKKPDIDELLTDIADDDITQKNFFNKPKGIDTAGIFSDKAAPVPETDNQPNISTKYEKQAAAISAALPPKNKIKELLAAVGIIILIIFILALFYS